MKAMQINTINITIVSKCKAKIKTTFSQVTRKKTDCLFISETATGLRTIRVPQNSYSAEALEGGGRGGNKINNMVI